MRGQLEAELDSSVEQMRPAMAPYGRFIRATLDELNAEADALREEIAIPVRPGGLL